MTRPADLSVEAFAAALPGRGALLGLDLGTKTIGLSISDGGRRIASPLRTIMRTRFQADAAELLDDVANTPWPDWCSGCR